MRDCSPHQNNLNVLKKTVPSMSYDGTKPFELWKNEARTKLVELLGLPLEKCDDELIVEKTIDNGEYTDTRFSFQSEPGYYVPCHMLLPKNDEKPFPVMICLQGHSTGMHISLGVPKFEGDEAGINNGDRNFAVQAVKKGFCAVALEQRCFGERGGTPRPDCHKSSVTALLLGRTTIGERVWDVSRLIDVLEKHFPQADTKRLGCMGNSGGGTATYYAACLEKRIKVAVPSCAVCTYEKSIAEQHHCVCNYIPGIRKYFEMADLSGLIAPRRFVMVSGKEDGIFPIDGAEESFDTVKRLYEAAGAKENCAWVIGEEGHRFYAAQSWPVIDKYFGEI